MTPSRKSFYVWWLIYAIIPGVIALTYIGKVFLIDGCFAFEANDEVAHTFVEIRLAWNILKSGELPLMNLYNNFGTPLIGDPVANPFALHALSYLMLPQPVAATLNRFLMIALSLSVLTYFYRTYFSFSPWISSICGIIVMVLPGFQYFTVNHPHQGSVLYVTLVFLAQFWYAKYPSFQRASGLFGALLLLSFGVGMNPFLLALPFLFGNQFALAHGKPDRRLFGFCGLLLAALTLRAPFYLSFFRWSALTDRLANDFSALISYPLKKFLIDTVFFQTGAEHTFGVFYSLPVIVLVIAGLISLRRQTFPLLTIAGLGILPMVIVLSLTVLRGIWSAIPLLRSTDISRVLWFSNIWTMASLGYAVHWLNGSLSARKKTLAGMLALYVTSIMLCFLNMGWNTTDRFMTAMLILMVIVVTGAGFLIWLRSKNSALTILSIGSLAMALLPAHNYFSGLFEIVNGMRQHDIACDTFFYNSAKKASFQPTAFFKVMKPYRRLAADFPPVLFASLQDTATARIFGADGRSINLHGGFKKYLLQQGIIQEHWYGTTYYFSGNDTEQFEKLGVQYVITPNPEKFSPERWQGYMLNPEDVLYSLTNRPVQPFLFADKNDISPVYLIEGETRRYLDQVDYTGNSIRITLPNITNDAMLVATFLDWPGWKAWIDGNPQPIIADRDYCLRVPVTAANRRVLFVFEPFTTRQIGMYLLVAIGIYIGSGALCHRYRNYP